MNTAVSYDLSLSDAWAAGLASLEIISANEALRLHHFLGWRCPVFQYREEPPSSLFHSRLTTRIVI